MVNVMDMKSLLKETKERNASDLHIIAGASPGFRVNGQLMAFDGVKLTPEMSRDLVYQILSEQQKKTFEETNYLDFGFGLSGVGRFRVNVHYQRSSVAAAFRLIPIHTPSLSELGLPEILLQLALKPKGLILVTGPTGSGKSTTLAAMINAINERRRVHIITIEDPIEYLHTHKKAMIEQAELGTDTPSFAEALKYSLRQDPDVILVGEMRDLETISTAITAAETGHLVLATLHTRDAPQTINRIIDVFPGHQQTQIRTQLASSLVGIIAQTLLPRKDGKGRVAALEILINVLAVANLIRSQKTHQISSYMQTGTELGMRTMAQSLRALVEKDIISAEQAQTWAEDITSLKTEKEVSLNSTFSAEERGKYSFLKS